jgi:hypothetical protein
MIFGRPLRLTGMEREKTGAELLLSEPEIVAWLGLTDEHAASARRTESRVRGRTALAWHGARRSGGGRPLPTARAHGLGIAL